MTLIEDLGQQQAIIEKIFGCLPYARKAVLYSVKCVQTSTVEVLGDKLTSFDFNNPVSLIDLQKRFTVFLENISEQVESLEQDTIQRKNQLYKELDEFKSRLAGEIEGDYSGRYRCLQEIIECQKEINWRQDELKQIDKELRGDGLGDDITNLFSDNREKRQRHSWLENEISQWKEKCNRLQNQSDSISSTLASKNSFLSNLRNPDLLYLGLDNNLAKLQVFLRNLIRKIDACRYGLFYVNQDDSDSIIKFINYVIVTGSLDYYDYEYLEFLLLSLLLVNPDIKSSFSENIAKVDCSNFLKSKLKGEDKSGIGFFNEIKLPQYEWSSVFRQKAENNALRCLEHEGIQYLNFNCSYDVLIQKETVANLSSLSKLEC